MENKNLKVNTASIKEFINNYQIDNYTHWITNFNLNITEEQMILLMFIIQSMNFCFWQNPKFEVEYKNQKYSRSSALFISLIKEVENNIKFLSLDYLNNLDFIKFKEIFKSLNGELSLLKERYTNLKETIKFINSNKNFYEELFSKNTDIELLNFITININHFKDESTYQGKIIKFNKRANLLVNDLYRISTTIRKNIKSVDNLTGCADYALPRIFVDNNIFIYNEKLSKMIEDEIEIKHNSEEEIEIRANTLYVIKLIKEQLNKNGINIPEIEIDNVIWNLGKNNNKTKVHHTTSIYY